MRDDMDERWGRVKDLFAVVIELPVAERPAQIAQACGGDVALRRELEELVRAHDAAGDFMAAPAIAAPAAAQAVVDATEPAGPAAPDRCGAYGIIRELGRGGMGAVYLGARADESFEKLVAVKVVSGELAHPNHLPRFQEERRILASLDHPNIARLLDAGSTEAGTAFFVMEYVEGEVIDEYCSKRRLPLRERLALFARVCAAVQYSHERLVVHRDIKARNILVTPEGVPKLLDFGIAKLLEPGAADSDATRTAFRALTPESASPEQVRGEPVTVATDEYSLGVLLYRLLTERSPYRGDLTTHAGLVRAICEEEPIRPSEAAGRPELGGDLDLIALKALRKDPERRYSSVEQLAGDIQRHLDRRPILAAPDEWTYRARKFLFRHWVGVGASAAVVLALLAGGTATWWQARRAERRFNDVRRLARTFIFDIHDAIARLPGSTAARRLLVTTALEYLDSLASEAGGDAGLHRELADAYQKMADVLGWPGTPNLGDLHGALAVYRKARAMRERLLADDPGDPRLTRDLSTLLQRMSRVYLDLGDPRAGAEEARRGLALEEGLAASDRSPEQAYRFARAESNYGYLLHESGRTAASLEHGRRAAERLETLGASGWNHAEVQQRLAAAYVHLAFVYREGKPLAGVVPDLTSALEVQRKAVAIDASLIANAALDTRLQRQVMVDKVNLAQILAPMGDAQGARDLYREGLARAEALARSDTANLGARADVAWVATRLGILQAKEGAPDEALALLGRAAELLVPVLAADTANADTLTRLAENDEGFGYAHAALGSDRRIPPPARLAHWREARRRFQSAYTFWKGRLDKGRLFINQADFPAALALEIARCDAALAAASSPPRQE